MEAKTELQKLLHGRLEELSAKHKALREKRQELDTEIKQLENDMIALNEALNVEARATGRVITKPPSNGSRLLGLRLGEAIRILREENPKATKRGIKGKLLELGYDFRGKRPGTAVHMAWTQLERQKHKSGDPL